MAPADYWTVTSFWIWMTGEDGEGAIDLFGEDDAADFVRLGGRESEIFCLALERSSAGKPSASPQRKTSSRAPRSRRSPSQRAKCWEVNCFPAASSRTTAAAGSSFNLRRAAGPASRSSLISISA